MLIPYTTVLFIFPLTSHLSRRVFLLPLLVQSGHFLPHIIVIPKVTFTFIGAATGEWLWTTLFIEELDENHRHLIF